LTIDQVFINDDKPNLEVLRMKNNIREENLYNLTASHFGPFEDSEENIKLFINDMLLFRINYTIFTYKPFIYENNLECIKWEIIQNYNLIERSHFKVNLDIYNFPCLNDTRTISLFEDFINKLKWIHIVVLVLAILSLNTSRKHISHFASIYMKSKSKHKSFSDTDTEGIKSEDSIYYNPLLDTSYEHDNTTITRKRSKKTIKKNEKLEKVKDKYSKFNFWSSLCMLGNLFQLFGSGIALASDNITLMQTFLIGFGCFLAWVNVVRYIEYHPDWSLLYDVIYKSSPAASRYIIGVFPMFVGFVLFGVCVFWQSERFADTSNAMITLFAMMQGDSVFDTFEDLKSIHFFVGQVYCLIFCTIFIL
jgi:hypothetical protein